MKSHPEVGEFKKHPVFSIVTVDKDGAERRFTFGVKKAQMIIEHLEALKAFVEANRTD